VLDDDGVAKMLGIFGQVFFRPRMGKLRERIE
jgi:hypothetical protein